MKPKTLNILYWLTTVLFSLFMLMDGIMGVMQIKEGQEIMIHLGYPVYILTILGVFKILGALALLVIRQQYSLLKEWAYAGFTFHFLGASASRAFGGDSIALIISPWIFLAVMFVTYVLWKRKITA